MQPRFLGPGSCLAWLDQAQPGRHFQKASFSSRELPVFCAHRACGQHRMWFRAAALGAGEGETCVTSGTMHPATSGDSLKGGDGRACGGPEATQPILGEEGN